MNYHEPQKMEGLSESYLKHKEESDQIIEEIKQTFEINKTYHDGLSEAQTIIGRLELEIQLLRNDILMAREALKRVNTLTAQQNAS